MTAVDNFIANLKSFRSSADSSPMIGDIDLFIAALSELVTSGAASGGGSVSAGRLTLSTGVPVTTANILGAASIFFTPYNGNQIQIFDSVSGNFQANTFAELSQTLADATKSPLAAVANSNYDMFVWIDAGVVRCTRGPVWTSATVRGAGVNTSELTRSGGILVNAQDITNGPRAGFGTYVGTIRTNAAVQCDMMYTASGAGGGANLLSVWNMYNRVDVAAKNQDTTDTWPYTLDAWRAKDGNSNNRISFVIGIAEDAIYATTGQMGKSDSGGGSGIMVSYDTETPAATFNTAQWGFLSINKFDSMHASLTQESEIGFHFVVPCERAIVSGITTWFGDNTSSGTEVWGTSTFMARLRM
jgi:hypothetical protein